MLILAATPIGNLEDASPRLARALAEADFVFAEDTRQTRKLLNRLGLDRPLHSFHEHSQAPALAGIGELLAQGRRVVYVSDAGSPGVSDPGYELTRLALSQGAPVDVIPGPSAVIVALLLSGLPCHEFCFLGFFPVKPERRRATLERLALLSMTAVFFEAPTRIESALDFLAEAAPQTPIAVCREMTKLHQETLRGKPAEVRAALKTVKGEFTLAIGPLTKVEPKALLSDRYRTLRAQGLSHGGAVKQLAQEHRRSKRDINRELENAGNLEQPRSADP